MQETHAIAIDGPVAAGKGTIASLLSKRLNGFHLNTGAMYRCLALYCLEHNVNTQNKQEVIEALSQTRFDLDNTSVSLNGVDVTERIRKHDVNQLVPKVAAIAEVRAEMVKRQREIGLKMIEKGFVVLIDARDAATKIFPDAKLKLFLTARPEVRAKRRYEQMGGKNNHTITFDQILADTNDRDYKDIHRSASPLVSNPKEYGYVVLDNSDMTEEETVAEVMQEWEKVQ
ncbi:MAG TPA: (d)CMP kinase [Candidatus Eisenbacteria bacterium]|nr:(d)CMP kinase [Candidatus Eisenbacteria bacterium]